MKKSLLILIVLSAAYFSDAQQLALSSQYLYNDFIINPAIAGTKEFLPVTLGVRRQWTGIKEAPKTQSLSANGFAGLNLGCGGYIINEVTGPTRRTSGNFSLSYHLKFNKKTIREIPYKDQVVLSFGLAATISQHKFDVAKLTTYEQDDAALLNSLNYRAIPDANAGIYFRKGEQYFAGVSVFNLVQTKDDLFEQIAKFDNGFKRTYYLTAGYNYIISRDRFSIKPTVLYQMIEAGPRQLDVNLNFIYKRQYWLGLGYRLKDAATLTLGLQYSIFQFSYSYDYTLSDIKKYSFGSHEISLTVLLGKGKEKRKVGSPK